MPNETIDDFDNEMMMMREKSELEIVRAPLWSSSSFCSVASLSRLTKKLENSVAINLLGHIPPLIRYIVP